MLLNALTIVMDILWIVVMRSVWSGKPAKNVENWKFFSNIRGITLFLSTINILLKIAATGFCALIHRGTKTAGTSAMH